MILGCPGGPNVITRVHIMEKKEAGDLEPEKMCVSDVAIGQGMWVASRNWKMQENGLSPRVSRKNATTPTHFRLLISSIYILKDQRPDHWNTRTT